MNELPYFLTASLYLLLFYVCYGLLLRRNTFFGMNRAYLLGSMTLSLLLPFVDIPNGTTDALSVGVITLPTFVVGASQPAQTDSLTTAQWIWLFYGFGVVVMLVRLGINVRSVLALIKRGTAEHKGNYTLVKLSDNSTPSFSFGSYLVLNQTDALTRPGALMRHEEAHIRQRHTADVLFVEVAQAIFWFNPVLWLYKHALQEVHEFLADKSANEPTYAQQLVAYALDIPSAALTTPFVSKSTLKQRIVMLQKPQTPRRALLSYALALPLAALLTMCTQSEQDQTITTLAQSSARKTAKVDGEVFTVVEQQPEFPGGMKALGAYMEKNLKYPEAAQKANIGGRVFVRFIVTKTGEITNVELLKGIGYGADEEAIRVVNSMPNWTPAKQNGQLVNVQYNLPINFQLDKNETAFKGINTFLIDGKKVTEQDITDLDPSKINRMDVDTKNKTIRITTK
ncbi:M56 family metallopeptidase [Spirosoma pollinicola]|uniref:Energy transducer TonB n=1 Tax=Spirosoma pollinicola TaxID=2057025 RepID=A0A2K8Z081_9BACT|nr:M56 family metallopeptidase [Spirosoma pollinicola]AUD03293.1 energy transducer TonB [Spirosoma pollinicola]